ncbi:hypothetical protein V6N13_140675 [Hibiscus sabdariffa]|uniref:Uncharacterized protein n=1 Tax=Hibiscus sabdariffa TaxID=183260 RepID=A0ABR2Q267_9ROSI
MKYLSRSFLNCISVLLDDRPIELLMQWPPSVQDAPLMLSGLRMLSLMSSSSLLLTNASSTHRSRSLCDLFVRIKSIFAALRRISLSLPSSSLQNAYLSSMKDYQL